MSKNFDHLIANIRTGQSYDIYCGRANPSCGLPQSKWHNPFIIGKDGDRKHVCLLHKLWLNTQPDLLEALHELKGKIAGCWCSVPIQECHCQTLHELADSKWVRNWFSNMLAMDEPLIHQGIEYYTVENFYQAMKCLPSHLSLRKNIAGMNAYEAKTFAKNKGGMPLRNDWEELKLKAMEYVLRYKFAANTTWGKTLELTRDWEITEWSNWGDKFFAKDLKTRQGENHLGKILMKIRADNRKRI